MIKCVFFLGYTTSWVIDNVQLIKYDHFFATGSDAVQGGCRSACQITCSLPSFGDSRWGPCKWLEATMPKTYFCPHTHGRSAQGAPPSICLWVNKPTVEQREYKKSARCLPRNHFTQMWTYLYFFMCILNSSIWLHFDIYMDTFIKLFHWISNLAWI